MTRAFRSLTITIVVALTCATAAFAQAPAPPDKIPVKVQVVISAFDGDRKVSSRPYTLAAIANGGQVAFLAGANVPIPTGDGKTNYTNVGTSIIVTATTEAGAFSLTLNIDDKSVLDPKSPKTPVAAPVVSPPTSTFGDNNYQGIITLMPGETKQVLSAADKFSGEIIKFDVTLTLDSPRRN